MRRTKRDFVELVEIQDLGDSRIMKNAAGELFIRTEIREKLHKGCWLPIDDSDVKQQLDALAGHGAGPVMRFREFFKKVSRMEAMKAFVDSLADDELKPDFERLFKSRSRGKGGS